MDLGRLNGREIKKIAGGSAFWMLSMFHTGAIFLGAAGGGGVASFVGSSFMGSSERKYITVLLTTI